MRQQIQNIKVGAGISEVGLPKIDVGLTKSYIKSYIKRVGVAGVVFAAVFLAVWAAMPVNGAGVANQ